MRVKFNLNKKGNNPLIKHKTSLLNLSEELGNISQACKIIGIHRDTFYRYQQAIIQFALDNPAFGQVRVSNELRKQGIFVSVGGVRSIWLRHHLANFKQRLTALEKRVAEQGIILNESQIQTLA